MNNGISLIETLITLCAISIISISLLNIFVLYFKETQILNNCEKNICDLNRAIDFIKEDLHERKKLIYQSDSSIYLLEYESSGFRVVSYFFSNGYLSRRKNGTVNKILKIKKNFEFSKIDQILVINIDDRTLYFNMEE